MDRLGGGGKLIRKLSAFGLLILLVQASQIDLNNKRDKIGSNDNMRILRRHMSDQQIFTKKTSEDDFPLTGDENSISNLVTVFFSGEVVILEDGLPNSFKDFDTWARGRFGLSLGASLKFTNKKTGSGLS